MNPSRSVLPKTHRVDHLLCGLRILIFKSVHCGAGCGKHNKSGPIQPAPTPSQEVPWCKVVWWSMAIPKHSFFLWLRFQNAVITRHKMCAWGYLGSILCMFCYAHQENRFHIFFGCSFSRRIWMEIMSDRSFINVPTSWNNVEFGVLKC